MRAVTYTLALLSLTGSQVAAAAETCLTPREATAVASYALPAVISGTSQRCGPVLGKDAYLTKEGAKLAARYSARKAAVWPEAKAALLKVGGAGEMTEAVRKLPDATVQPLVDSLVTGLVVEQMPTDRCSPVDRALWLLSPLPPENTAELIALSLGLMAQGKNPRIGKIAICKS
ncbi:hypothetical protein OKA06_13535 [Novosphingobium sp. MW5]|nr:hypothetical protein [Novosphingobium sp. MW5]